MCNGLNVAFEGENPYFSPCCNTESNSKMVILLKFLGSSSDVTFRRGAVCVPQREDRRDAGCQRDSYRAEAWDLGPLSPQSTPFMGDGLGRDRGLSFENKQGGCLSRTRLRRKPGAGTWNRLESCAGNIAQLPEPGQRPLGAPCSRWQGHGGGEDSGQSLGMTSQ